jgi:hypothetical protein
MTSVDAQKLEEYTSNVNVQPKLEQDSLIQEVKRSNKCLSPSVIAPKLVCPAFVPKPFPIESRRPFDILHRLAVLMAIVEYTERGWTFKDIERRTRNGRIDLDMIDQHGNPVTIEASGTAELKLHKIIQACLYKEKDERIAVSSIYERMELSCWLIETINHVAPIVEEFLKNHPDVSSQVYLPHCDLCPRCDHPICPEKLKYQTRIHSSRL